MLNTSVSSERFLKLYFSVHGVKEYDKHCGDFAHPYNFEISQLIETKRGTVVNLEIL